MAPAHKLLFMDFETYYDQEYSLKNMTPPEYILDPKFETIGCAVKEAGQPSTWVDGPDFPGWLAQYDPEHTTTCTFNALFDNCILGWRYGWVPSRMYCAMRMAAALYGHKLSGVSLAKVAEFFHLPPKGTAIQNAKGLHRADLMADPVLWQSYQDYANHDNNLCEGIFNLLIRDFPHAERRIMDHVLRTAVSPRFIVDTKMLADHLVDLKTNKITMLRAAAGMPEDDFTGNLDLGDDAALAAGLEKFAKIIRSNDKFEELLKARGVDVEYKPSGTDPTRVIPAFAKTDEFMSRLQEDDDPIVQALAAARLGLRSTIEESRGKRILTIASLPWENFYRDGNGNFFSQYLMPIPLKFSAAHTHRLGGDWLVNMQNLPSSRQKLSKLRKSLVAPPGHKVVVADLAQIECRINGWLCGQRDLLDIFRAKGDPYSVLATSIFELPVDKTTGGGLYRFIGKSGVLGLGFRCGAAKFYNMVVRSARILGMDVRKLLEVWTPELAEKSVREYRRLNNAIQASWYYLDGVLDNAWMGTSGPVQWGPVTIGAGYVEGPGGLRMNYADPRCEDDGERWYTYGRRNHKIHGGVFLENIVQFLARIVIMYAALRITERTKIHFALQAHDELAWIVPDAAVDVFEKIVYQEMTRPPSWCRDIPLDAEVNHGQSYGDAK